MTVITDTLVIDLSMSAAREGRQTHIDFADPCAFHGREPMIARTSNAVEKSAKRRIGWPSGERYGGCVMAVP